jgi:hypothetical protein
VRRPTRALDHVRIRLDAHHLVGALGPGAGREARAAAEIDDEPRACSSREERQHVEQLRGRRRPIAIVDVGEAFVQVAGAVDQLLRELAHGARS